MAVLWVWDGRSGNLSDSIRSKTYCLSFVLGTRGISPEFDLRIPLWNGTIVD